MNSFTRCKNCKVIRTQQDVIWCPNHGTYWHNESKYHNGSSGINYQHIDRRSYGIRYATYSDNDAFGSLGRIVRANEESKS